jgi:single-stranded-DNA-specific exonuclease
MSEPTRTTVAQRSFPPSTAMTLMREGAPPLLARVLAGRGLDSMVELGGALRYLFHHSQMKGAAEAAHFIADGIEQGRRFLVVADYDCDGATACAVTLRGMRALGANINFIVPDRMVHGYGLTPSVVDLAFQRFPTTEIIVTVDNGVASHAGVERALELGLEVIVTDHHLPAKGKPLPPARVIVDPSQPGCEFPTKATAGVGVIWYVLWALQDELKRRGIEPAKPGFKVSSLLPLVAVGSVADIVPLDENNRILIQSGLERIRSGQSFPGIEALATAGITNHTQIEDLLTTDIAFGIGPRINAAGRLETMDVGIECLVTDDPDQAAMLAMQLTTINQTRKEIEHDTVVEAVQQAEALVVEGTRSIAVHSDDWHAGVIGIVAGRIKERRYRPTFVMTTDSSTGQIKGSGRSIPGFNLKDCLDSIDKTHPRLMPKFGGHAMAAGVTLRPGGFEMFRDALEAEACKLLTAELLNERVDHDGSLSGQELCPATARQLSGPPWGQMFPQPAFCDTFDVVEAKVTGKHRDQLNMVLTREGVTLRATRFRFDGAIPKDSVKLIYKLALHRDKRGNDELRLLIDHIL